MVHQLANLLQQVKTIESERKNDKKEIATLHNLLKEFNGRVKKIEANQCIHASNLETTKVMVTEMLNEVPQVSSVNERFEAIEDKIEDYSQQSFEAQDHVETVHNLNERLSELEQSLDLFKLQQECLGVPSNTNVNVIDTIQAIQTNCNSLSYPDGTSIAEIINELEERNKRKKSLVIHNLPETSNAEDELANVSTLITEILQDCSAFEFETDKHSNKPRLYRLGRKSSHNKRSLKVHLKSSETRDQILANSRILSKSPYYKGIVIQKDMTPLERIHLKRLVYEKNRRNHEKRSNHLEANWTIRGGILCQK